MDKDLAVFADMLRLLKLKDKARFLHDVRKYALLYDPQKPQDIPECSVDERAGFSDQVVKYLFYNLRGHYYGKPILKYYSLRSDKEIKEQAADDICQKRIYDGLHAYCQASEKERKIFERRVKMPKLFASFWRRKSVLDYDFR